MFRISIPIIGLIVLLTSCAPSTPPQAVAPSPTPTPTAPSPSPLPTPPIVPTPTQPTESPQTSQPLSPQTTNDRQTIEIDPGKTSTTVSGKLASKAIAQYRFDAAANQPATVTITSPNQTVLLTLVAPSGSPIQRYQSGLSSWSGTLPETGTYQINVVATDQASDYQLSLAIAPKKAGT